MATRTATHTSTHRRTHKTTHKTTRTLSGVYGTRGSTVVVVQALEGRRTVHVVERTYDESGREAGMQTERLTLPIQR